MITYTIMIDIIRTAYKYFDICNVNNKCNMLFVIILYNISFDESALAYYHLSARGPTLQNVSPSTTPSSLFSPFSKVNPGLP